MNNFFFFEVYAFINERNVICNPLYFIIDLYSEEIENLDNFNNLVHVSAFKLCFLLLTPCVGRMPVTLRHNDTTIEIFVLLHTYNYENTVFDTSVVWYLYTNYIDT